MANLALVGTLLYNISRLNTEINVTVAKLESLRKQLTETVGELNAAYNARTPPVKRKAVLAIPIYRDP